MKEYYKIYAWVECPFCVKARELLSSEKKQFMFCCIDDSEELLNCYVIDSIKYFPLTLSIILSPRSLAKKHHHKSETNMLGGYKTQKEK